MINKIETVEDFAGLEGLWRKVEDETLLRVPQTYDWCYHAWVLHQSKESGARLWILHWTSGKGDHVIFPFYIDRRGELRFIMDSHNDVNDVVCVPGRNYHMAFYEAAEAVADEPRIKSIWFMYLYGGGVALNYFGVLFPARLIYRDHAFSWINFTAGDNFICRQDHLKSKDKANLKALRRKSEAHELVIYSKAAGYDYPHDVIRSMRDYMLRHTARKMAFFPDSMISFCEKMYDLGLCKLAVLKDGDEVIAFNFIECMKDRELSWIFMYKNDRASTELYVKYFHAVPDAEVSLFDFGVGAYRYKLGTFRPCLGVTFSMRYGKSWIRQLSAFKEMNLRAVKDYLKLWYKPESH